MPLSVAYLERMNDQPGRPHDEREWAEQIRSGSYSAFEVLFSTYYEELVAFVRSLVHRHDVAEELVQDVFFNIWRQRHQWRPRGSLRAYLYGAARNQSYMYARHRRVERRWQARQALEAAVPEPPRADAGDAVEQAEVDAAVRRAIAAMPERRRAVFTLSRQHGLTYAEIAAVLEISVNTVENHMAKALKTLRQHLAPFLSILLALL